MKSYYAHINGNSEGPFTLEELKDRVAQKIITPQTYVIPLGSDQWISAREVQGLFPASPKLPNLPPHAASAEAPASIAQPINIGQTHTTEETTPTDTPLKFAWTRFKTNPSFYVTFGAITLLVIPIASQLASFIVEAAFAAIGSAGGSYAEIFSLIGQIIGGFLALIISLLSAPFYPAFFSGMQTEAAGENCQVSKLFNVGSHFLGSLLIMVVCGLVVGIGFIFCIIPGIILLPLIPISFIYQARGIAAMAAIGKAFNLLKSQPSIILYSLGYMSLGLLGILLCCVGQIATYPIAYAAIFKAVGDQDPV
jgi:hypothetical protein